VGREAGYRCASLGLAGLHLSKAEFIDPWLVDKVNSGISLSYRPASHVTWRAGTTTLCRIWLYPPVRDLQYGNTVTNEMETCCLRKVMVTIRLSSSLSSLVRLASARAPLDRISYKKAIILSKNSEKANKKELRSVFMCIKYTCKRYSS